MGKVTESRSERNARDILQQRRIRRLLNTISSLSQIPSAPATPPDTTQQLPPGRETSLLWASEPDLRSHLDAVSARQAIRIQAGHLGDGQHLVGHREDDMAVGQVDVYIID